MPKTHSDLFKKKISGGRKKAFRGKRVFEMSGRPTETKLGETHLTVDRVRGGRFKNRLLKIDYANVSDPKTGKTKKSPIVRVVKNSVSVDYDRRGIITKGTIIETKIEAKNIKIYKVSIALLTLLISLAPKYWAITIVLPEAIPITKEISVKIIGNDAPTAASASLPIKFPTIILSTTLYNC